MTSKHGFSVKGGLFVYVKSIYSRLHAFGSLHLAPNSSVGEGRRSKDFRIVSKLVTTCARKRCNTTVSGQLHLDLIATVVTMIVTGTWSSNGVLGELLAFAFWTVQRKPSFAKHRRVIDFVFKLFSLRTIGISLPRHLPYLCAQLVPSRGV